jgi:MYXO-CTERM domain-containing protein
MCVPDSRPDGGVDGGAGDATTGDAGGDVHGSGDARIDGARGDGGRTVNNMAGCGCTTAGGGSTPRAALAFAALAFTLGAIRRRRRRRS